MKRFRALAAAILLPLLPAATATAQDTSPTISVNGEGVVRVAPDQAIVRFGVVTRHENPEEARSRNAVASREAMNAVRDLGVADHRIQLETLQIQPERRYNQQTRQYEQIGFEAVRQVKVTLDDLDLLPVVVVEVIQKGANRLNGIAYDLSDRESVRLEALRIAAENARTRADLLAGTLGATVGFVRSVQEGGIQFPGPQYVMREADVALRAADAAPEPEAYAAGEIEVRAHVAVTFYLLQE